jgi:hypothetical protein
MRIASRHRPGGRNVHESELVKGRLGTCTEVCKHSVSFFCRPMPFHLRSLLHLRLRSRLRSHLRSSLRSHRCPRARMRSRLWWHRALTGQPRQRRSGRPRPAYSLHAMLTRRSRRLGYRRGSAPDAFRTGAIAACVVIGMQCSVEALDDM